MKEIDLYNLPYEIPQKLSELQRKSYDKFLNVTIRKILKEISPITDYSNLIELHLEDYILKYPTITPKEAIERNLTYSAKLIVTCKLLNKITKEEKIQNIFFGDIPLLTEDNIFILNGVTRVIMNQIVRSPGIYYTLEKDNDNVVKPVGLIMPYKGAWLETDVDLHNKIVYVKLERKKKILATTFLRAMKLTEEEIKEVLTEKYYNETLKRDKFLTYEEAVLDVFKKTKPDNSVTVEIVQNLIEYLLFSPEKYDLKEVGRYKINQKTGLNIDNDITVLTPDDIKSFIKGYIEVLEGKRGYDDIDHLGNRRIRLIDELIEEEFRKGINKIVNTAKEQMSIKDNDKINPQNIINYKYLKTTLNEFFLLNQLSQILESTNELSIASNKRKVTAIGKGGLSRNKAGFEVRDIHYTHYGRLCHIETPEGANIGLIMSLGLYADIDEYGFIITPYRVIDKVNKKITEKAVYLNAIEEDNFYIAPFDTPVENGYFKEEMVKVRYKGEILIVPAEKVDFIDISPVQTISMAAGLIPFLHHDDATRASMGANMQRQAVPLINPESPLVKTGIEKLIAKDFIKYSDVEGYVKYVDATKIVIETKSGDKEYGLLTFFPTKKETTIRERAIIKKGDYVKVGDPLYYQFNLKTNELSLGRNVLVAYMPFYGYNYEDAILISERLVKDDVYTSIHIEKYEVDLKRTKLGEEEFTKDIPNAPKALLEKLDDNGYIKIGSYIKPADILVGKVTPKGDKNLTPEERLLRAIFGNKAKDVKDTSYKVPNGGWGCVIDIKELTEKDELEAGVIKRLQIYVAKKKKIEVGDKMAGRHGNKGVVAKILPEWAMPHLEDGTPIDIVLNPLGVPSRMNIGQVLETQLGLLAKELGVSFIIPPFNTDLERLKELGIEKLPEKVTLIDGMTGEPFENKVTVGYAYMLKLHHLVDDKVHARSTGNYSFITQQPLGGKAQGGGQRFGEMEVWALEGYGAANMLQEMITIKSDDVQGRENAMKSILEGRDISNPNIPESFRVLVKELCGLGIKVDLYDKDGNKIELDTENQYEERFILEDELLKMIKPWK